MRLTRRHFVLGSGAATFAQTPANNRVQVGVIGCGARSQQLMHSLMANPGVAITAISDAYQGRVTRTQENWGAGAKAYRDYREILARKDVDAVIIATPDHWHQRMCLDAIAAGKDIYCEKPLTYKSSEGKQIAEAAAKAGRIVQVGSQGCSGVLQERAREIVQSGKIGRVTLIRAAYNRNSASGAWLYPIPPDATPQTVDWDRFLGNAPKHPYSNDRFFRWRCFNDYSGGIATDLFVHLCTTIQFVMKSDGPTKAMAMGQLYRWKENRDVYDTINGLLEYPEGFAANLSSTFNNESLAAGSFQFLGTEGTLVLNFTSLQVLAESGGEDNRWIVESWPRAMEKGYYEDPKVQRAELKDHRPARLAPGSESYIAEGPEATERHFAYWLQGIRTRQGHWENAQVGHRAAACAHMLNQSAREERVVKWDPQRNDIAG
ncbi:MAG: Gfo/Idh/MocA family oxidoreductase [Bryobacteraceae bacterium]|nr:Gfo/Idh/MocA family oxidoreductase [Bryobacteraceae bacterium]